MTTPLLVWAWLAAVACVTDMYMTRQRLAGKRGQRAKQEMKIVVARCGGLPATVAFILILDIALPPVALAACLFAYRKTQRQLAEEREQAAAET